EDVASAELGLPRVETNDSDGRVIRRRVLASSEVASQHRPRVEEVEEARADDGDVANPRLGASPDRQLLERLHGALGRCGRPSGDVGLARVLAARPTLDAA